MLLKGMWISLLAWSTSMAWRWEKVARPTSWPLIRTLFPWKQIFPSNLKIILSGIGNLIKERANSKCLCCAPLQTWASLELFNPGLYVMLFEVAVHVEGLWDLDWLRPHPLEHLCPQARVPGGDVRPGLWHWGPRPGEVRSETYS